MTENILKRNKKKKGFTLIELIVVIAIIAIISLIAIPKVMGYQDSAKKKADVANAKSIANTVATEIANGHISTAAENTVEVVKSTKAAADVITPAASDADINYYITKNMQSIPTQQYQNSDSNFRVKISTDGSVEVFTTDATTVELYPDTADTYK